MIYVEGYMPLSEFYVAAKRAIYKRLDDANDQMRKAIAQIPDEAERDRKKKEARYKRDLSADENTRIAAKFLSYDLIQENEAFVSHSTARLCLYAAGGSLTAISSSIIRPHEGHRFTQFSDGRVLALRSGLFRRKEMVFGIQSLNLDYWITPFLEEEVFSPPSDTPNAFERRHVRLPKVEIINWELGCVSVCGLASFVKALSLMSEAASILDPLKFRHAYRHLSAQDIKLQHDHAETYLKSIQSFDGLQIFVPVSWMNEPIGPVAPVEDQPDALKPPFELILKIIDECPDATKAEVRDHFSSMATREFNRQWERAAEMNPEIRKPGRRRPKS